MNPIILIPGIQGTRLSNVNHTDFQPTWSGLRKFFTNLYHLRLKADGRTDAAREVLIEPQDVEDLAYSEIINFLRHAGHSVYIFGYDWRKSNLHSGQKLGAFVEALRCKHPRQPLSFLTHSMGALVPSAYFKTLSLSAIKRQIHKVIFTCPPFLGSHEAFYNLLIGRSRLFNRSDDFRKLVRTFPSIYELCPLYPEALRFTNGAAFQLFNYRHWQQNPLKKNYRVHRQGTMKRLRALKQVRNQDGHIFNLAQLPADIHQRMLVLAGTGQSTQRQVQVKKDAYPLRNQFIFSEQYCDKQGDGTVHLASAACFKTHITTLALKSNWLENRIDGRLLLSDWHSFFLNNGRVQNIIQRFLQNPTHKLHPDWFRSPANDEALL